MTSLRRRLIHLLTEAIEFIYLVLLIPFIALILALEWSKTYYFPTWLRLLLWGTWYFCLLWLLYRLNQWLATPLPPAP